LEFLYNGRILTVDLSLGEAEEEYLEEDLIWSYVGGAAVNSALYQKYEAEDPVIVGTGLLTGTLAPGACLGVVTIKDSSSGRVIHSPLAWFVAPEIKMSGFDFIVIKGKSDAPIYLWIHDGVGEVKDASEVLGADTWQTTDKLRKTLGEDRIQVLSVGRAGEEGGWYASLCNNYWGGEDKLGLGGVLGRRGVKALAFRGLGELKALNPKGFLSAAEEALKAVVKELNGEKGLYKVASRLGWNIEGVRPFVHRYLSCFNCPFPCRAFVKYNEPPDVLPSSKVEEPGVLLTDLPALAAFIKAGFGVEEALRGFELCCRMGVDGVAAVRVAKTREGFEALMKGAGDWGGRSETNPWNSAGGDEPIRRLSSLSSLTPPIGEPEIWRKRVALGYVFGLCPILLLTTPSLSAEIILKLTSLGSGIDLSLDDLSKLLEKAIPQG